MLLNCPSPVTRDLLQNRRRTLKRRCRRSARSLSNLYPKLLSRLKTTNQCKIPPKILKMLLLQLTRRLLSRRDRLTLKRRLRLLLTVSTDLGRHSQTSTICLGAARRSRRRRAMKTSGDLRLTRTFKLKFAIWAMAAGPTTTSRLKSRPDSTGLPKSSLAQITTHLPISGRSPALSLK